MGKWYASVEIHIKSIWVLASWLTWLKHHPVYQKDVGSIPGQDTYLGCGFNTQLG